MESRPRSPVVSTSAAMSRNGVGSVSPLRTTRIWPARSTTNTRERSRGGAVTYMGALKSPTGTKVGAAPAPAGAASATSARASRALVIRDMPVLGLEREPAARPLLEPADHGVRVPAGAAEGVGRHARARAEAAVEDDGPVAVDRLGLGREALELDVARARD